MPGKSPFPAVLAKFGRFPEQSTDLAVPEIRAVWHAIAHGAASKAQIGALLMGLRLKGATALELATAVEVWQGVVNDLDPVGPVLHLASGFGGMMKTIDLSLPASLVASAAGVRVFLAGSSAGPPTYGITPADVLPALGIKTTLAEREMAAGLASIGWTFGYLPTICPRLHRLAAIRRELHVATLCDQIEQLITPVGHRFVLVSVESYHHGRVVAETLKSLGTERATVILGDENSIDLPLDHPVATWRVIDGRISEQPFNARDYGLTPLTLPGPQGLTLRELARMYEEILSGQPHPYREAVQLNAAMAIYTAGVATTFADALRRADEALLYGTAYRKLREFRSSFALK